MLFATWQLSKQQLKAALSSQNIQKHQTFIVKLLHGSLFPVVVFSTLVHIDGLMWLHSNAVPYR